MAYENCTRPYLITIRLACTYRRFSCVSPVPIVAAMSERDATRLAVGVPSRKPPPPTLGVAVTAIATFPTVAIHFDITQRS